MKRHPKSVGIRDGVNAVVSEGNKDSNSSTSSPDRPADRNSLWRQLLIAVVGGIFAALTTVLAGTLAAWNQDISSRNDKYYSLQKDILDKRFLMMERFVQISQKNHILLTLDMNERIKLHDLQKSVRAKDATGATAKIMRGIEATEKFNALKAEYVTVIAVARTIFGPKTRNAIDALLQSSNPNVWDADSKFAHKVVDAMTEELLFNLPSIEAKTVPIPVRSNN